MSAKQPASARGYDQMWLARYKELKEYKAKHGHRNVPARLGQLGNWVYKQRHFYRSLVDGNPSNMTGERIVKLEDIAALSGPRSMLSGKYDFKRSKLLLRSMGISMYLCDRDLSLVIGFILNVPTIDHRQVTLIAGLKIR